MTSHRKLPIQCRHLRMKGDNGFTLIEIMIVIAIMAGIIAVGIPKMFSSSTNQRAAVRKMAIMTREIRNNSRLYNSTSRLVLMMDKEKGYAYWVESAPGSVALMNEQQREDFDKLTSTEKEDAKSENKFDMETRITKDKIPLPKGLRFEAVEIASRKEPITSGVAYVHFFPQGLADSAAIQLTDGKTLHWTISINPLTGRAQVFEKKISLKELGKK